MVFPFESATLNCIATLENPKDSPVEDLVMFFDMLILCYDKNYGENHPTVCSVHYDRSSVHDILVVGALDLTLNMSELGHIYGRKQYHDVPEFIHLLDFPTPDHSRA